MVNVGILSQPRPKVGIPKKKKMFILYYISSFKHIFFSHENSHVFGDWWFFGWDWEPPSHIATKSQQNHRFVWLLFWKISFGSSPYILYHTWYQMAFSLYLDVSSHLPITSVVGSLKSITHQSGKIRVDSLTMKNNKNILEFIVCFLAFLIGKECWGGGLFGKLLLLLKV